MAKTDQLMLRSLSILVCLLDLLEYYQPHGTHTVKIDNKSQWSDDYKQTVMDRE